MSVATDAASSALQSYQALGSNDALNTANQQYDVGGSQTRLSALKGIVGNLQSSVEAVDPSVTGRTTGNFTTDAQRSALVSKEQAPILGNLNKQQGALTSEQGDLTQKQTLASQMATALLSDDKAKYQRLLDTYNQSSARDAAAEQQRQYESDLAEKKREANLTDQQEQAKLAAARISASTPSSAQVQANAVSSLGGALRNAAGKDGYVSPQSYAAAKRDWIGQGYSSNAFDSTFAAFRNPYAEDVNNGAKRSKADYAVG
jgi:hypothetical protein